MINKIINTYIATNDYYKYSKINYILNNYISLSICYFIILILINLFNLVNKMTILNIIYVSVGIFLIFLVFILFFLYKYELKINNYSSSQFIEKSILKINNNIRLLCDAINNKISHLKNKKNNILIPVTTFFLSLFLGNDIFYFNSDTLIVLIVLTSAAIIGINSLTNIINIIISDYKHSPTLYSYSLLLDELYEYRLSKKKGDFFFKID